MFKGPSAQTACSPPSRLALSQPLSFMKDTLGMSAQLVQECSERRQGLPLIPDPST